MSQLSSRRSLRKVLIGLAVALSTFSTGAQERDKDRDKSEGAVAPKSDELSAQAKEVLGWTNELAREITQVIEGWLASGAITPDRLFSWLYYPIVDTDPTKYNTDYDSLADRDFQAIVDKYVARSNLMLYAVATDKNGYVPTHNRQYSQPLTGNRALDLVNNRTKRIYGDQIGFKAARNRRPFLLQVYARDTGEYVADLSVPLIVRGQHWGCVRVGYRQVDRQQ